MNWYQQFFIIYDLAIVFQVSMTTLAGLDRVDYLRDLTFAIVTPLEFLYPQAAYCEASLYSVSTTSERGGDPAARDAPFCWPFDPAVLNSILNL